MEEVLGSRGLFALVCCLAVLGSSRAETPTAAPSVLSCKDTPCDAYSKCRIVRVCSTSTTNQCSNVVKCVSNADLPHDEVVDPMAACPAGRSVVLNQTGISISFLFCGVRAGGENAACPYSTDCFRYQSLAFSVCCGAPLVTATTMASPFITAAPTTPSPVITAAPTTPSPVITAAPTTVSSIGASSTASQGGATSAPAPPGDQGTSSTAQGSGSSGTGINNSGIGNLAGGTTNTQIGSSGITGGTGTGINNSGSGNLAGGTTNTQNGGSGITGGTGTGTSNSGSGSLAGGSDAVQNGGSGGVTGGGATGGSGNNVTPSGGGGFAGLSDLFGGPSSQYNPDTNNANSIPNSNGVNDFKDFFALLAASGPTGDTSTGGLGALFQGMDLTDLNTVAKPNTNGVAIMHNALPGTGGSASIGNINTGTTNTGTTNTGTTNTGITNTGSTNPGMSNGVMIITGSTSPVMAKDGMSNTGQANTVSFNLNTGQKNTGTGNAAGSGAGQQSDRVQQQQKAGQCPARRRNDGLGCQRRCTADQHCQGAAKCCQNACGVQVCQAPVKPGTCPRPSQYWRLFCADACYRDTECRGGLKCCNDGSCNSCVYSVEYQRASHQNQQRYQQIRNQNQRNQQIANQNLRDQPNQNQLTRRNLNQNQLTQQYPSQNQINQRMAIQNQQHRPQNPQLTQVPQSGNNVYGNQRGSVCPPYSGYVGGRACRSTCRSDGDCGGRHPGWKCCRAGGCHSCFKALPAPVCNGGCPRGTQCGYNTCNVNDRSCRHSARCLAGPPSPRSTAYSSANNNMMYLPLFYGIFS